jgi:hypothetical protein
MDLNEEGPRGQIRGPSAATNAAAASRTSVQLAAKAVPLIRGYGRLSEFRSP